MPFAVLYRSSRFLGFLSALAFGTAVATSGHSAESQQFISIGTGGVTGVYYPTGGAICRLVNKDQASHGVRCSAEATAGSIYNINTVRNAALEFGVAQSDWQYHALEGTSQFEEQGPFDKERSVFSVYAEPLSVLVRADSDVRSFSDLRGKRVNIGNTGSSPRALAEVVMDAYDMDLSDFAPTAELRSVELATALCDDKIDAMVYAVAHPASVISEITNNCDVRFVEISGPEIDRLIDEFPYYRSATIPAHLYRGQAGASRSFGVAATVITSADVADELVYIVVKSVFENFRELKKLHPAFANLEPAEMIRDALSAPLHDAAVRYYRERGWM